MMIKPYVLLSRTDTQTDLVSLDINSLATWKLLPFKRDDLMLVYFALSVAVSI